VKVNLSKLSPPVLLRQGAGEKTMNIDVNWDNETKTIIRYLYKNGWNWDDYFAAIKSAGELLDTVDHKVDIIMDFHNANLIPQGAITQVQRAFSHPRHPNIRLTIFVGANAFIRAIEGIGRKLAPTAAKKWDLAFAATLEEAYHIAEEQRGQEQTS
jgi:hypothetical protein